VPITVIRVLAHITMRTDLALTRLFQLISPSLPIGGYTYSQGVEWAVEAGWIKSEDELDAWLSGLIESNLCYLELPVLFRMMDAWTSQDMDAIQHWNEYLLASRETLELRQEELNRARAFYQVLTSLDPAAKSHRDVLMGSQHACFSYACVHWGINQQNAAYGLSWSWLENTVLSAVKIIPLGQSAGQRVIFKLSERLPYIIEQAALVEDMDIGSSSMAMSIASAQHETQYTRLFRS
jgi:urease accessory protein